MGEDENKVYDDKKHQMGPIQKSIEDASMGDDCMSHDDRNGVAVITPIKNEKENLNELIDSVKMQTQKPSVWVLVNDNSDDGSEKTMRQASQKTEWIQYIETSSRNDQYDIGSNYARVIKQGYHYVRDEIDWRPETYMILDGDMKLHSEECLSHLFEFIRNNNQFAIASAGIYIRENGELTLEERAQDEPAGAVTVYDGKFYDEIEGPPIAPAVDSVTKAKARIRGYRCRYLSDLVAIQSRPTGSKNGYFANAYKRGGYWFYHGQRLDIAVIKSLYLTKNYPHIHSIGYLAGYLHSMVFKQEQIPDEEIREYFRNEKTDRVYSTLKEKILFWK